jgi:hypothetical protein
MKKIEYCENSTITEAWAVIIGTPGEVRDSEAGALENNASKVIENLITKPSFVFVEQKKDEKFVPPFWHKQLTWDEDKFLARMGHRYLSVHYIKKGDDKYEKYETTLEPQIDVWLNAYKETIEGHKEKHAIDRVIFGYVNSFIFNTTDFELKKYFKIIFGTGLESAKKGISNLGVDFSLNCDDINVSVNLKVMPDTLRNDQIVVTTKVEGHRIIKEDFSFDKTEKILTCIRSAKEVAKTIFFDLSTDETQRIMGAKDVSS